MENLYQQAKHVLLLSDPDEKMAMTQDAHAAWIGGTLQWREGETPEIITDPGRPDKPELVMPRDLDTRGFNKEKGRAALIHALAHIELTAVNLAWDSIYRYRDLPQRYYDDWVTCAQEESGHFLMLRERLREMGYDYGSFPAHNELWKMAVTTGHDLKARMALVHRVLEARALDVIPGTIKKYEKMGDRAMVNTLTIIANDEIGHVSSGSRWYRHQCDAEQLCPDETFFALVKEYMSGPLKGPFNRDARIQSGFSEYEMDKLEADDPRRYK